MKLPPQPSLECHWYNGTMHHVRPKADGVLHPTESEKASCGCRWAQGIVSPGSPANLHSPGDAQAENHHQEQVLPLPTPSTAPAGGPAPAPAGASMSAAPLFTFPLG